MGEKGTVINKQSVSVKLLMVLVHARRHQSLNKLPSVWKQIQMLSGRSLFAAWSMMLKKRENKVGARMHSCLMLLEIGKLPDSN